MRLLTLVLCLLVCSWSHAQDSDYVISLTPDVTDIVVGLDNLGGDIQGWSLAVCHDFGVSVLSVVDGSTTATVGSGGGPPAFDTITLFPDGWTVGVVIDFLGCCTLSPGTGYELNIAEYDPGFEFDPQVCFCDATLGSPAVAIVVVVGGSSLVPTGVDSCASLCVIDCGGGSEWQFFASTEFDLGAGPSSSTVEFSIVQTPIFGVLSDTQGFSMGRSHFSDFGTVASVADPVPVGDLAALNGGAGPDFVGTTTFPNGWTAGVVYSFLGTEQLQFPAGSPPVLETEYSYVIIQDDVIPIELDQTLGSPPVASVVVIGGSSLAAQGSPGAIVIEFQESVPFLRADCNDDGIVNIADAIWTLNTLFLSGPSGPCPQACDANNDFMIDSTDAVYTLNYRLLAGPPPAAPFPDCGGDGHGVCELVSVVRRAG